MTKKSKDDNSQISVSGFGLLLLSVSLSYFSTIIFTGWMNVIINATLPKFIDTEQYHYDPASNTIMFNTTKTITTTTTTKNGDDETVTNTTTQAQNVGSKHDEFTLVLLLCQFLFFVAFLYFIFRFLLVKIK